jgi:hypothetical protein
VYVNGGSRVPFLSYSPNVREGRSTNFAVRGSRRSESGSSCSVNLLQHEQTNHPQAALKNTMADAPTTTKTKTSIKMAGSTTTRSALPVVVACISRMPTVAR